MAAEVAAKTEERGAAPHEVNAGTSVGDQLAHQCLDPIPATSAQLLSLQPERRDRNCWSPDSKLCQ